jgi:CopG family nickel-responsive transcriptional regulator
MEQVERIGVSLERGLLGQFDELIKNKGYASRSEALRDLIRDELSNTQA